MPPTDLFQGSWALVTGASSGIGEELARQLARRGANLVVTARRAERLEALAVRLRAECGVEVRVIVEDLGRTGGARALAGAVDGAGLTIDHLVNNAGFGMFGRFTTRDPERLAEMLRLNCEALTVLSRHFLPGMTERRRGGVIHVASVAGFLPMPFTAAYAASKAYVLSLSVALAEEVRGSGVRVTALCPGPVPTEFQQVAGGGGHSNPFRSAVLSAAETARQGLEDYERGRSVSVPGVVNTATAFATSLLPRGLVARTIARFARRRGGRAQA